MYEDRNEYDHQYIPLVFECHLEAECVGDQVLEQSQELLL
jgi:hypothetical protein